MFILSAIVDVILLAIFQALPVAAEQRSSSPFSCYVVFLTTKMSLRHLDIIPKKYCDASIAVIIFYKTVTSLIELLVMFLWLQLETVLQLSFIMLAEYLNADAKIGVELIRCVLLLIASALFVHVGHATRLLDTIL